MQKKNISETYFNKYHLCASPECNKYMTLDPRFPSPTRQLDHITWRPGQISAIMASFMEEKIRDPLFVEHLRLERAPWKSSKIQLDLHCGGNVVFDKPDF